MPKATPLSARPRGFYGGKPGKRPYRRITKIKGKGKAPRIRVKPRSRLAYKTPRKAVSLIDLYNAEQDAKAASGKGFFGRHRKKIAAVGALAASAAAIAASGQSEPGVIKKDSWGFEKQYHRRHPTHLVKVVPDGFFDNFGAGLMKTGGPRLLVSGGGRDLSGEGRTVAY